MKGKDIVSICDLAPDDAWRIINSAVEMKQQGFSSILAGQTLALLFEKPSLRTRVSFDVAMHQLGGYTIYLSQDEVGIGSRESVSDVARTLSRYVNIIAARTFSHATVVSLAEHATVPVINALSDKEHPCQALADLLTIYENKAKLKGLTLAFIGDGNNVANSLLLASALVGMNFRIASPLGYEVSDEVVGLGRELAQGSHEAVWLERELPDGSRERSLFLHRPGYMGEYLTHMRMTTILDEHQKGDAITGRLRIRLNPEDEHESLFPIRYRPFRDGEEVRISLPAQ